MKNAPWWTVSFGVMNLLASACARPAAGPSDAASIVAPTPSPETGLTSGAEKHDGAKSAEPAAASSPDRAGTPPRRPAGKGDACAGIAGIPCEEGLRCQVIGPPAADRGGICVAP